MERDATPTQSFYLRTGAGSGDKTALYLLDPEQDRSLLSGPLFYRVHYFEGYHFAVAAGTWLLSGATEVLLQGVEAVIFTEIVDSSGAPSYRSPSLFAYETLSSFEARWPLDSRPGLTLTDINTWGGAKIPGEWAVHAWPDAQRLANLIVGEAIHAGVLPTELLAPVDTDSAAFPSTPSVDEDGEEDDWEDEEENAVVRYGTVKEMLDSVRSELADRARRDAKWTAAGIGGLGFLAGAAFALNFARVVGPRRASELLFLTFVLIPMGLLLVYVAWRSLWARVRRR